MRHPTLADAIRGGCPLLIAGIVILCFRPVLGHEFVNWDDVQSFEENLNYRGLSLHRLRWMFTTVYLGHYQPLSWLTHALVYTIGGMDPTGYHLLNLLLHMGNAVVFYFVVVALLRQVWPVASARELVLPAAVGALFFALHPLRVEPVAWATERREVLAAFFLLLSVLAYLRMQAPTHASARAKRTWFTVSLGCYALSLLSKATGMTLPVALLVLDIYPLRRFTGDDGTLVVRSPVLAEKVPYLVLAVGAATVALLAQTRKAALTLADHGVFARVMQAMYGLVFYPWKTVLPSHLSPLYLLETPLHPLAPRYVACAIGVVAITVALVGLRRRWPGALAAWVCYVVLVSPVLGLVQAGPQLAADRYTYVSCMPFAVLVGAGIYLLELGCQHSPMRRCAALAVIAAVLAVLAVAAHRQTRVWHDSLALWNQVLAVEPMNRIAYNNRAWVRHSLGDFAGALADANEAVRLDPQYALAYLNRGKARWATGDRAGALADYERSIGLDPTYANAYLTRGNARQASGDMQAAIADFTTTLQINPQLVDAYYNRGNARKAAGDLAGAVADYTAALELNPQLAAAYNNRGTTLREQGHLEAALADYDRALRINPRYTVGYLSRAGARRANGDLGGAIADYAQALQFTPPGDSSRPALERHLATLRQEISTAGTGQAGQQ